MEKLELLEYLLNHRDYFKEVSLEDFSLLASLEPSELGLMNKDNYKITPLLKQIGNYTLVDINLFLEDIEDVENILPRSEQKSLLDALDIADKCCQYVDILLEEGAHHPCLTQVDYLINGAFLYDTIIEITCELIKITDGRFQNDLIDFGNIVDDQVVDITDGMKEDLLQLLASRKMTSGVDLLRILSDYIRQTLMINNFFPINSMNIDYINDTYIHWIGSKETGPFYPLSMGNYIQSLSLIMQRAHKYQDYTRDDEILKNIHNLEESYYLYNSYRYLYIKNQYQEHKMLQKCKKM